MTGPSEMEQTSVQGPAGHPPLLKERMEGTENPRARGKPLKGDKAGVWRYRMGGYRILCHLDDNTLVVFVVSAGHRKEVYR